MKALLAIFITIGLFIGVYIVSALIYFDLTWVLIGVTSLWAGIDSRKIGLSRYKLGISSGPAALFCICYLFWIFTFPYYLWARFKIKEGTVALKDETTSDFPVHPAKRFFHWVSKRSAKIAAWLLYGLVVIKIAVLGFCLEESWRGQHVWQIYKHELEARGEYVDWNAMVRASVPDSENFYSAPMMSTWFVEPSYGIKITNDIGKRLRYTNSTPETAIAEIRFVRPGTSLNTAKADALLRFDDPRSSRQIKKLIQKAIGTYAFGSQGLTLLAQPLNVSHIQPPQILLETDQSLNARDLISFFPSGSLTFRYRGSNSWLVLTSFCTANDYLKWSAHFEGDFGLIREAVKRPYARMGGDYSFPPAMPIPNFVNFRTVSQTLALRAQCFLLRNQPDDALRELLLLNALRSKLECAPTGKPMPLVSAMINVAIAGLYVQTAEEGFRLQAWREPQLIELEEQLAQINLAASLKESFQSEAASSVRIIEVLIHDSEVPRVPNASLLQKIKNLRPPDIMRGFFYFNAVEVVRLDLMLAESVDVSGRTVRVSKAVEFQREDNKLGHPQFWQMPYQLYAMIAVPDFAKAVQTFAFNQTKVDEAQIVCALECYRLENGSYPQSLSNLLPKYIGQLPCDIINGRPLKYKKTSDGGFLLYSVGWNQIDDGGQFSSSKDQGDWVWQ